MNEQISVSMSAAGGPVPSVALPEAQPKVTVRGLNFYYGEHHALKNINLTLGANRVTAFIGPSGCGKSTLLRIFNRMYDLYPGQRATGQLMLDATNVLDPKLDLNLLRARVGMVFQKPTPFPMTIYENIAFGMPVSSSGKATLSMTLRQGKVDSSWNTMPIAGCGPRTRSPATVTVPW